MRNFSNVCAGWFGHEFGESVLVSCLGDSVVDVIETTYGQPVSKAFEKENFVQVHLKQGQAIIMGSGLRHRVMKYSKRNVRLFIAFLAGRSSGASFGATYNVKSFKKNPDVRNLSCKNKLVGARGRASCVFAGALLACGSSAMYRTFSRDVLAPPMH